MRRLAIAAVSVLLLTGGKVYTHNDPFADFAGYRTFQFEVTPPDPATDPSGNRAKLFEALRDILLQELDREGLQFVEQDADLKVVYTGYAGTAVTGGTFSGSGAWTGWTFITTDVYDEGTLILDFVDARSGKSVWRAATSLALPDNDDDLARKAQKAAVRLLKRYPPK